MKIYFGKKTTVGPNDIFIRENDVVTLLDPKPSQDIYNHSPDGFNWGYGGSGPAQASLGILFDCLGRSLALSYYQRFKWDFVAGWNNEFCISVYEINYWLNNL